MTQPLPASVRDVAVASDDPLARAAAPLLGGPIGRYARVGAALPWRTAAVALTCVATLTMASGMFSKGYCVANGWRLPDTFWRGCYSDLPFLFAGSPLAAGGFPYAETGQSFAQPPLTGALMWLVALVVPNGDDVSRQRFYFLAWGALTMVILALLVRVTACSVTRDPWRAAHVAASPLIVTTALVSPDLFGVALASYGLFFWSRSRPELAGVLFGLAIAARTYPVMIVLVIGLLALRAGRLREWAATAGAAMVTFAGTLLALFFVGLASGTYGGLQGLTSMLAPYRQWWTSGPDYGSLWYLPGVFGVALPASTVAWLAVLGWVVALGVGALVALSAPRRPTIAEVSLIVVGVVMLTGRSLPVQSALWLLPLVALAGLRWRDHLIWATGEILYFVAIWLYLGGQSDVARGLPLPWLAVFSVLRLGAIGWLVVAAWRQAVRRVPESSYGASGTLQPGPAPEDDPAPEPEGGAVPTRAEETTVTSPLLPVDVDDLAGPLAGRGDQVTVVFS